jgi:hypothetical protein
MKKILLSLLCVAASTAMLNAEKVKVDDIWYELSEGDLTAAVAYGEDYTGDIVIPETFIYDGQTYTVTAIPIWFSDNADIQTVSIPKTVTNILDDEGNPFSYCIHLTAINVAAENPKYSSVDGVLFNKEQTMLISYPSGKAGAYTIPNSVTSLMDEAFAGSVEITSLTIPSGVANVGIGTFTYCPKLTAIQVDGANPIYSSDDGVLFNKAKTTLITCPGGKEGTYAIPAGVTAIQEWGGFSGNQGLTSVTFPASLTKIASGAFGDCQALTAIVIPSTVDTICEVAFYGCPALESLTLAEGLKFIGGQAFEECTALKETTLPASLDSLGKSVFRFNQMNAIHVAEGNASYCDIDGVLFNKEVTELVQYPGGKAVAYTIPSTVTAIAGGAFAQSKIKKVVIPDGVEKLWYYTFNECRDMDTLIIGSGMTFIDERAFYSCTGLKAITCKAMTPPELGFLAFGGLSAAAMKAIPLYVPNVSAYQSISGWNAFDVKDINTTGLTEERIHTKGVKILRDGHLFILRNGRTYTMQGIEIE